MERRRARTRALTVIVTAGLALTLGGSLVAHDFWLVPEFFVAPEGWRIHIYANTGERFPESMAALAPERVARAHLVGADEEIALDRMHTTGSSLALEVAPPSSGQWYVGLEVRPRRIDLTAEQFNEYLAHDGLPDVLELRRRRGELDEPGRERYSRGAKALIHVGEGGPAVWDRRLGHTIELVPLNDPERLAPGDTLRVRLLFRGDPVPDAIVSAGHEGQEGHVTDSRTDAEGIAGVAISNPGRWYVRTIHMIERPEEPEFDWESYWATLTFEVTDPGRE